MIELREIIGVTEANYLLGRDEGWRLFSVVPMVGDPSTDGFAYTLYVLIRGDNDG